jgi:hypothetical protein
LALALNIDEARKALEQGRWTSTLLFNATDNIAMKLGINELPLWWRAAWVLRVEGFHEAKLNSERVKKDSKYIEAIVNLAKSLREEACKSLNTC